MIDRRSAALCGVGLILYAGSWLAQAALSGHSVGDIVAFAPGSAGTIASALLPVAATLSTAFVVLFLPGLALFAGVELLPGLGVLKARLKFEHFLELLLASFLVSIVLWVGAALALGGLGGASHIRHVATLYAALIIGALLVMSGYRLRGAPWRGRRTALVGLAFIAIVILALRAYLSFNVLSDDEIEAAEFAISLRDHVLPYWDLENGTWGFYPNFMLFAYPAFALTQALGQSEFAFRMLYFVSLLVAFVGCGAIFESLLGRPISRRELAMLTGAAALVSVVALFYNSWHPYLAGLAQPSGVDMFGFALFTGAVAFFHRRRDGWFLAFAWAHFAALPNGAAYTLTWLAVVFAFARPERLRVVRLALVFAVGAGCYQWVCASTLGAESALVGSQFTIGSMVSRYLTGISRPRDVAEFIRLIVLLSGGGILLVPLLLRRGLAPEARAIGGFVAVHTGLSAAFYSVQHPHYQLPLMLLVCVGALCAIEGLGQAIRRRVCVALALGYAVSIAVLMPRMLPAVDNARRLGAQTRIDCGTADLRTLYEDANGLASPFEGSQVLSWLTHGLDRNQWLYYVRFTAKDPVPLVISVEESIELPSGFRRVGGGGLCQVAISDRIDPDDYLPRHGYRNESGWWWLSGRSWREHFRPRYRSATVEHDDKKH